MLQEGASSLAESSHELGFGFQNWLEEQIDDELGLAIARAEAEALKDVATPNVFCRENARRAWSAAERAVSKTSRRESLVDQVGVNTRSK